MGIYPAGERHSSIWIHAVSVGEFNASIPIIAALLKSRGSNEVLITTTTSTASSLVIKVFGDKVKHVFFPFDIPLILRRFISRYNPKKIILLETELWPNLLDLCQRQKIPVFLVNARLSDRSFNRYQFLYSLMSEVVGPLTSIGAQNIQYVDRFEKIGYPRELIQVTGNLKFEVNYRSTLSRELKGLFDKHFSKRRILVCGSTRSGEESRLMPILEHLKRRFEDLLIVIAPRHPERVREVSKLCLQARLKYHYRSEPWVWKEEPDVLILDTIGELSTCYSVGDVAFVGGSLQPFGGQNILEPSYFGIPSLAGPHTANFQEEVNALSMTGALTIIGDEEEFLNRASYLLENDHEREVLGLRGRKFIESERGSLQRTLNILSEYDEAN